MKILFNGEQVEATPLGFQPPIEPFVEYKLADGSTARIKLVVNRILRIEGQKNDMGEPLYVLNSQPVMVVDPPAQPSRPN